MNCQEKEGPNYQSPCKTLKDRGMGLSGDFTVIDLNPLANSREQRFPVNYAEIRLTDVSVHAEISQRLETLNASINNHARFCIHL